MKKYKDAFDNLTVPDDMTRRVAAKLAEEPAKVVPVPKKKPGRRYGAAAVCSACLALAIGIWRVQAAAPPAATVNPGNVTIANPVQEASSPEELSKYLGYTPLMPQKLPADFAPESYTVIDGAMAQIVYKGDSREATYRTAAGDGDVSGDYNVYSETRLSAPYTLLGDGGAVSLVRWTQGGYSYSISFDPAVPEDCALQWANSVK